VSLEEFFQKKDVARYRAEIVKRYVEIGFRRACIMESFENGRVDVWSRILIR
jgi:predicted ABC-class ATPase